MKCEKDAVRIHITGSAPPLPEANNNSIAVAAPPQAFPAFLPPFLHDALSNLRTPPSPHGAESPRHARLLDDDGAARGRRKEGSRAHGGFDQDHFTLSRLVASRIQTHRDDLDDDNFRGESSFRHASQTRDERHTHAHTKVALPFPLLSLRSLVFCSSILLPWFVAPRMESHYELLGTRFRKDGDPHQVWDLYDLRVQGTKWAQPPDGGNNSHSHQGTHQIQTL